MSKVLKEELNRLCVLLEEAVQDLRSFSEQLASAEHSYRNSKAKAWGHVTKMNEDGSKRLASEIEADVNALTSDLRYMRDLADGNRQACLESVRSRRQQLSALQSWMAAERAEAEFARTAP